MLFTVEKYFQDVILYYYFDIMKQYYLMYSNNYSEQSFVLKKFVTINCYNF